MTKRTVFVAAFAVLLIGGANAAVNASEGRPAAASPSIPELLEKAIFTEETVGDLDAAIAMYRQILAQA